MRSGQRTPCYPPRSTPICRAPFYAPLTPAVMHPAIRADPLTATPAETETGVRRDVEADASPAAGGHGARRAGGGAGGKAPREAEPRRRQGPARSDVRPQGHALDVHGRRERRQRNDHDRGHAFEPARTRARRAVADARRDDPHTRRPARRRDHGRGRRRGDGDRPRREEGRGSGPRGGAAVGGRAADRRPGGARVVGRCYRVFVTLRRPAGLSRSSPRSCVRRSAVTCPGTTAENGLSHSGTPGTSVSLVCARRRTARTSEIAISRAPRARSGGTISSTLGRAGPLGATRTTGQSGWMAAIGPCIRSAGEYASVTRPESSRIFRATSNAVP